MKTKVYLSCNYVIYIEGASVDIGTRLMCNEDVRDARVVKYEGEAIWNPEYRPDRSDLNDTEDI